MDYSRKKLIVVVGPTAVGKTNVSIQLAKKFGTEIISADSRQFFKELEIGTAKPTEHELQAVRHHFINSLSITQPYDAASYGEAALGIVNKLFQKLDFVIVCGGSGLYINALLNGFDEIPKLPDNIRNDIVAHYKEKGLSWLQENLRKADPEYYKVIDQQNPARLMRALEVVIGTGKSISTFQKSKKRALPFIVVRIGLELDREELYARIDRRMEGMIEAGLFVEAQRLYPYRNHNALQTVGYTEIFDFIDGIADREETVRLLKRNSRRYAKRQLTWFKKDKETKWFKPDQMGEMVQFIQNV